MTKTRFCASGSARPANAMPLFAPPIICASDAALLAVLHRHPGARNAITSAELAAELHMSTRLVRATIACLVEQGALIGASVDGENGGYFMIKNEAELESTRAILRSRARGIFARDNALRRSWERSSGRSLQPLLPEIGAA